MALTKGQFLLYQTVAKLQAALIKNDKRVELTTGERYLTAAVNSGGLLLASGNYANPISELEINQPANILPISGAVDVTQPVTLTSSAAIGTDLHIQSIWTAYSDAGGTTEVYNSGAINDLLSHIVPDGTLLTEIQYWFGVQYVGVSSLSTRSALTSFTTAVAFSSLFATTLYTGTGTTQDIVSDLDYVAGEGLVWIKSRNTTNVHYWYDTLRGPLNKLSSNSTNSEGANANSLTSFNADGFSVGSFGGVNTSADPLVAWQFMEAQGFFDIVEYTGNGVAGRTVALDLDDGTAVHGMSIVKNRDDSDFWLIQHKDVPATDYVSFTTAPPATLNTIWNDTAATTTALTLGTNNTVNFVGDNYISYNFAHNPTKGIFCGSYTGTGAAGNKVVTGFPAGWLLVKRTDAADGWQMVDIKRLGTKSLNADLTGAEFTLPNSGIAFDSDGFTVNTSFTDLNASGGSYIFMAIADPAQF